VQPLQTDNRLVAGSSPTQGANENFATFAMGFFYFFNVDGAPIFKPIASSILSKIL